MPRIILDAAKWLRGASVADTLANGGFSPSAQGVDLFRTPGTLKPGVANFGGSTISDMLSRGVLAWYVPRNPSGTHGLVVLTANSSDDGRIITLDGFSSSVTMASDTTRNYTKGYSDLISFKGSIFATSTTNIALSTGPDYTWWTGTLGLTALNSLYPHYMCEYEDEMYITDGRYIHKWNGAAGTYNALDLPEDYVATSICKHNGYLWIAAEYYQTNQTGSLHGKASIFIWDGYSPSWIDEKVVNERIDTLFPHRGVLYMTTRKTFGYWNGSAIVDLWPLPGQVLKHQIAAVRDRILFVTGNAYVTCYGHPIPGRQRFFSFPMIETQPVNWDAIATGWGDSIRRFSGTTAYDDDFPATGSTTSNAVSFLDDPVFFGAYVKITGITVVLDADVAAGEDLAISYINSNGDTVTVGTISNSTATHTGRREIYFQVENDEPVFSIQPKYTWGGGARATGIKYVIISYEPSEDLPT